MKGVKNGADGKDAEEPTVGTPDGLCLSCSDSSLNTEAFLVRVGKLQPGGKRQVVNIQGVTFVVFLQIVSVWKYFGSTIE